jgi:protease secretion system membrane fusion protein
MNTENTLALPAATTEQVTDANEVAEARESIRAGRIGLWALAIGFGGFLLWAAFAPLDEGVPSQGLVSISTKRKTIQHQTGGIVKEVLVQEGDHVKEGQVLLKLDEAATRANYETVRQEYFALRAMQGRLIAEQTDQNKITFNPELLAAAEKDPQIRNQVTTQQQLFQSRRSALRADLQGVEESVRGQESLLRSYQEMLPSRKMQLQLINDELTHTRELVTEGYIPRNRQLELERMVADSNGSIAELLGNIARTQNAVAELRQRGVSTLQAYRKEVEGQLSDTNRQVQADEAKFRALEDDLNRVELRSPAAGQVVGLSVQTVGGVIQPGQKIMDIVPENELLLIETKVAPNLIDRVHAGLPVDIRFNTFSNSPVLLVEGKVISVSGDLLTDANGNNPYYLTRVSVTPEGYKQLGNRVLQPGMPVEVVLRTGERSMLAYLLHPLVKRLAAAMKEE